MLALVGRDGLVLRNGLWFEMPRSRGVSMANAQAVVGRHDGRRSARRQGQGPAFNPIDDTWLPFEVDIDTGEVTGGSYPPELPQP